jgi:hypothetical protein
MLGALLTLLMVGVVGVVMIGVVMALIGMVVSVTFGVFGFLLFKVAPVVLIGWLVMKAVGRGRAHPRISQADQRWLDS